MVKKCNFDKGLVGEPGAYAQLNLVNVNDDRAKDDYVKNKVNDIADDLRSNGASVHVDTELKRVGWGDLLFGNKSDDEA